MAAQEFEADKHDHSVVKHAVKAPLAQPQTPVTPPLPTPPVVQTPVESITINQLPPPPSSTSVRGTGRDSGIESSGGQTHRSVNISQLTILYSPNPANYYPSLSKRLEEEGRVQLRIFIDEKGIVENTEVVRSSQSTRLDAAAARLARDTRFKPYAPEGEPIRITALLTVSFRLTH